MRKKLLITTFITLSFVAGYFFNHLLPTPASTSFKTKTEAPTAKPLERYSIENLQTANIKPGKLEIGEFTGEEGDSFASAIFKFSFNPSLEGDVIKTTSGLINLPKGDRSYPAVIMIRGFVDQTIYKTGVGSQRAGEYFAENGFLTIAPDFLGYADSDIESSNIFESRFQTYITVLSLLKSLDQIPFWDGKNVFIWGHSNGGQIALTTLEATKEGYPTVLWAPVSKPFPYSILYYTDGSEDKGKFIRAKLAEFESIYDAEKYSLDNYLGDVAAPIQIHQGTYDDAVPYTWSKNLHNTLKSFYKEKDITFDLELFLYPGSDHNLQPDWQTAVSRSLSFFQNHLTK